MTADREGSVRVCSGPSVTNGNAVLTGYSVAGGTALASRTGTEPAGGDAVEGGDAGEGGRLPGAAPGPHRGTGQALAVPRLWVLLWPESLQASLSWGPTQRTPHSKSPQ